MSQQPRAPRYGQPNFEYIARMAATPPEDDGPVYMVNLMKYRTVASYADGNPAGRTGREADDAYAPTGILRDIGAEIVFVADVQRQLAGDAPAWDRVAIVKYPTRVSFLAMQRRADFKEKHVHKDAGMEQTIVLVCTPLPPAARAEGASAGHNSAVLMHVLKFAPGEPAGPAHDSADVRFAVEAAVIGDGRAWDEVRFEHSPDVAAAPPSSSDAVADRYTLLLTPSRDRLAATAPA